MFAVIKTGGKQYRVEKGDVLEIEKLGQDQGKKVTFNEVLLVVDDKNTLIGTPYVEAAQVKAEIVEDFKDKKVIVFKKKRRKGYKKKRGHRQEMTRIKIEDIVTGKKAAPKKETPASKESKPAEKKEAAKPKVPVVKKPAVKKPAQKTTAKKDTAPKTKTEKPAAKKSTAKTAAKPKSSK